MSDLILDNLSQTEPKSILIEADKGKRLVNFLIDATVITFFQTILVNIFQTLAEHSFSPFFEGYRVIFGFNFLITPIYYILAEYLFKGKTVGKIITKTRVVTLNGERPTFNQIFGRSFARVIPFEPLSYLGDSPNGWHDRLSETIVIDEQKSDLSKIEDELV